MRRVGLERVARRVVPFIRHWWCWWIEGLLLCVPKGIFKDRPSRWEVYQVEGELRLAKVCPPEKVTEEFVRGEIFDRTNRARSVRESRMPIWIVPPDESVLSRTVEVPASMAGRFDSLIALEIDRWSPYGRDELYLAWSVVGSRNAVRRSIELRFIPKAVVQRWIDQLRAVGVSPTTLVLGQERRMRIDIRVRGDRSWQVRTMLNGLGLLSCLSLGLVDWMVASRTLGYVEDEYRGLLKVLVEQSELENELTRQVAVIRSLSHSAQVGVLLAKIAAILPETDWASDVAFKDGSVTLSGYTADVERLSKMIETISVDRLATLQGEVALDSNLNKHRFTIVFRPETM